GGPAGARRRPRALRASPEYARCIAPPRPGNGSRGPPQTDTGATPHRLTVRAVGPIRLRMTDSFILADAPSGAGSMSTAKSHVFTFEPNAAPVPAEERAKQLIDP